MSVKFMFWFFLGLIFYAYAGYSLLIFLLSFFIRKKIKRSDFTPDVSILIAAYNEEKNIRNKLKNTLELDYPKDKLEIVVVSDGSTDNTDAIVKEFSENGVSLFRVEGRVGKTEARNRAVKTAKGQIIVFSDATTVYDKQAVRNMVRNFYDPQVGAVSGRYDYLASAGSSVSFANIAFWKYENFIKQRQSLMHSLTGMSGCINSFRKQLYVALPADIIEDLVEPLMIIKQGYRIIFEPQALAYELTTESAQQEFKMRVRVISQGMRGLLFVKELFNPFRYGLTSFQLFSHKVLRWFIPELMIGLFICNLFLANNGIIYTVILLLQLCFYLSAFAGFILQKLNIKNALLSIPLYFCTVNIASLAAFWKIVNNQRIIRWETQR